MTTKAAAKEGIEGGAYLATWTNLTTTDVDGEKVAYAGASDRTVQVVGTFGAGGTVVIEGSNDGTNWATLTDPQGNALSFTAAKVETVMELTRYIRPRVTGGDGTTDLTVILLMRSTWK